MSGGIRSKEEADFLNKKIDVPVDLAIEVRRRYVVCPNQQSVAYRSQGWEIVIRKKTPKEMRDFVKRVHARQP